MTASLEQHEPPFPAGGGDEQLEDDDGRPTPVIDLEVLRWRGVQADEEEEAETADEATLECPAAALAALLEQSGRDDDAHAVVAHAATLRTRGLLVMIGALATGACVSLAVTLRPQGSGRWIDHASVTTSPSRSATARLVAATREARARSPGPEYVKRCLARSTRASPRCPIASALRGGGPS